MKIYIKSIVCYLSLCCLSIEGGYSQVGINTKNPLGIFHVDSSNNNPEVGTPSVADVEDDVIVTSDGRVGLGTISPVAKLDVRGNLQIIDGTQGENKKLITDGTGLTTWTELRNSVRLINPSSGINIPVTNSNYGSFVYNTGTYMDVPVGTVLVSASFRYGMSGLGLTPNGYFFLQHSWSDNPTTWVGSSANFNYLTNSLVSIASATPAVTVIGSGYWIINNKSGNPLRMYLYAACLPFNIPDSTVTLYNVGGNGSPENTIIIMPM